MKSQVLQSLSNIEEFSKVIKTLPSLDERQVSSTISICILPSKKSQAKKNKERRKSGGPNGALGLDGIILTDELKKVTFTIQGHNDVKLLFSR